MHRRHGAAEPHILQRCEPCEPVSVPREGSPQQPDETPPQERLGHRPAARSPRGDLIQELLEGLADGVFGPAVLDERLGQVIEQADAPLIGGPNPQTGHDHLGRRPSRAVLRHDLRLPPRRHDDHRARGHPDALPVGELQQTGASKRVVHGGSADPTAVERMVAANGLDRQGLDRDFETIQELLERNHRGNLQGVSKRKASEVADTILHPWCTSSSRSTHVRTDCLVESGWRFKADAA